MFNSSIGKQCELSGCQNCQLGARRNHFIYSALSVAKYFVRRNKNSCCTSQRYSDIGSLFATFLLISRDKESAVFLGAQRAAATEGRAVKSRSSSWQWEMKWKWLYDTRWGLARGDFPFVRPLGWIPATSKLHRPDLLLHPVTSCWSLPQPIDGELSRSFSAALRLLNYATHLCLPPDPGNQSSTCLVQNGSFFKLKILVSA